MTSLRKLNEKYLAGEKLVALTGYDALMSSLLAEAGVDFILVGDSLSNVIAGYPNTLPVNMEQMLWHTQMTVRGAKGTPVVADMPFMSYEVSREQAMINAGRFIKEGGADAVKLEGGSAAYPVIKALTEAHIPVCGHVGLQPQSVLTLGGYSVQGKTKETATKIKEDALAVQEAGAFAVVLEMIPADLAAEITSLLKIPTIGIGAGPHCSGQILVTQDLLGMTGSKMKIAKRYAELRKEALEALSSYVSDVKKGLTPSEENSF
ncbi:3-methyl-2-oxobutanoate hydroxymethyltransferase [bacterium]|nr:3-methyl-2-oxobutanoate hydroxymethyltransferase [bacterium]